MATFDPLAYARGAEMAQQQNWRDQLNEMRMQRDAESLAQSQAAWQLNFPLAQQQAQLTGETLTQQGTDLAAMRRAAETQTQLLGELSGLAPAEQATKIAERIGGRLQQLSQTPGDRGAQSEIRAYQDYVSRLAAGYDQARDFDSAARLRAIFAGAQGQSPLQQQITAGSEALAAYQRGERMWQDPRTGQITLLPENPVIAQTRQTTEAQSLLAQLRQLRPDLADRYALIGNQIMMLPPVPQIPMPVSGVDTMGEVPLGTLRAPARLNLPAEWYPPVEAPPVQGSPVTRSLAGMFGSTGGGSLSPQVPAAPAPAPASTARSYGVGSGPMVTNINPSTAPAPPMQYPAPGSLGQVSPNLIQDRNKITDEMLTQQFRTYGPGVIRTLLGPPPLITDRNAYETYKRNELELNRRFSQLPVLGGRPR